MCLPASSVHFLFYRSCGYLGAIALRASCGQLGSLFDGLMALHPNSRLHLLGTGAFLGGPNVAIGKLFIVVEWPIVNHSHSFWAWRLFSPWFSSSHVPRAISFAHPFHTNRSAVLHFDQKALTGNQDWTWLWFMCIMVCFVPFPPTISFTHPNHPDRVSDCALLALQSSPFHKQWTWLGWICPHLRLTPCSLTLPHTPAQGSGLLDLRLCHRWFGCSNFECELQLCPHIMLLTQNCLP